MKLIVMILCIFIFESVAFGAGEFDQINSTIADASNAAKTTMGLGLQWIFGWLPLLMFIAVGFGSYMTAKKKAEQDQNNLKIAMTTGIGAIVGFFVGIGLVALLGTALLGDSMKAITVARQFWASSLGI